MYAVLRPIYEKTGEKYTDSDGKTLEWNRVSFVTVGLAEDMEDAKRRYPLGHFAKCYSWVLQEIAHVH